MSPSTLPTMPAQDLTLTTEMRADSMVIRVAGELDLSTVAAFDAALEQALAVGPVVVELSECTFIDSSALQSLVRAHRIVREGEGGAILLVAPSQPARRVLEVAALDRFMPVFETVDEALDSTA
jgi:anti-sigma B factor antagonist